MSKFQVGDQVRCLRGDVGVQDVGAIVSLYLEEPGRTVWLISNGDILDECDLEPTSATGKGVIDDVAMTRANASAEGPRYMGLFAEEVFDGVGLTKDDGFDGLESEDLIAIINDGRSQLRELTETLESQTRSLASDRASLELKSEEIADLHANAKAAKCSIGDLAEQIREMESTMSDQSKLLEEQRLKINAEDEEARKADECTTRLEEQNATISKLEESNERLKSQNDGLIRECQKLTNCVIGGAMTQFLVTQGVGNAQG